MACSDNDIKLPRGCLVINRVSVCLIYFTDLISAHYWPCVTRQTIHLSSSFIDAQSREHEEADTVSAFASLSVVPEQPSG